jgi:hypothetical protein
MAARQRNILSTLVLITRTIFLTLHSVKRKTLLAQLINCHNNKRKNVYSMLPCLREMNRIYRHFVYISIDTTYNRYPYMIVFVKRWFMTIFNVINIKCKCLSCSVKVGMKSLNIEMPVTRNFIRQILLNVQDFYFHKVGYTSYDEGIFGP